MKFLVLLLLVVSCAQHEPVKTVPPIEVITSSPTPDVTVTPSNYKLTLASIEALVGTSECSKVNWKNRGKATLGYIKGLAFVYARSYCNKNAIVFNETSGDPSKDALAHYNIKPSGRNTFAFLIGLGMRESSGRHCVGRDTTASNTSSSSAEAGMFQTSYNSNIASPDLKALTLDYHKKCYLEVFKDKVTCSDRDWSYYGSGIGLDFQKQAKECPAFAADYAAITLRVLRKHYGPINRQEVEFKKECVDMLASVEDIVKRDPSICSEL